MTPQHPDIDALVARSNRLGSDKRVTNFAGGNTSAKVTLDDPITGRPVRVLAVKGSGGDLGTMTPAGLAFLDLERVVALERVYDSGTHEDDIVGLYALCAFGDGGKVPSIDTPLHAFVRQAHVDHLHPDSMIAMAAAEGGEELVAQCYGDEIGWLPWLRPGFELGLALRDFQTAHPEAKGVMLGGHGMMVWADTSDECEALSLRVIEQAEQMIASRPDTSGTPVASAAVSPGAAARLAPMLRGVAGRDRTVVGSFTDAPVVREFLDSADLERLVSLGTSCPDHFLRTKVKPMLVPRELVADLPATDAPAADWAAWAERLDQVHAAYRADYAAYYDAHADAASPAMRGADPAIVLVPGLGMWSYGADLQTAQVAGEFYINAINVMRGAERLSGYDPITDDEKFRIEYWELEERKLRMRPPAPRLQGRIALVTGGASGIGRAICERLAAHGALVAIADLDHDAAAKLAADLGSQRALAVTLDVSDEQSVEACFDTVVTTWGGVDLVVNNAGFARSAPLVDTTIDDWERLHAVLARGAFLVSRRAAQVMAAQRALGGVGGDDFAGDIVYIASKNSVVAGPQNIAYGAAKADQAHQMRLLAAELGPAGVRVNAVNPDAVVRGSGIFSGDWLEQRAAAYEVSPDKLGSFYASRTLLGREVLPDHVAAAVLALVDGTLPRTTGLTIPVDGGLAAAFLR